MERLPSPNICQKGKQSGMQAIQWLVEDARDKLLTQISDDQLKWLTWSATNKGELTGEAIFCYSFGRSNHESILFRILRRTKAASNTIQTLDFTRAEFSLFRDLIDGILCEAALKDKWAEQTSELNRQSPTDKIAVHHNTEENKQMNKESDLAKKGIHDCRKNVQKRWRQGEMLPKK